LKRKGIGDGSWATPLLVEISFSSRSRSSPVSLTTYFFTEISFAAMIASLASRWRRKRITKSFQIG
jgi:hypothetical protein